MELIVKIGADQQGLQQTITRMKTQFETMNVSTPAGWATPRPGTPATLSAGQRQFLAQQEAAAGDSLSGAASAAIIKKGTSLLKGILFAELTSLAAGALDMLGTKFWEKVYGADAATNARILAAHKKMTTAIRDLLQSRAEFGTLSEESRLNQATPENRRAILAQRDVENRAAVRKAQKEFEEARTDVETATGLNGKPLDALQRRALTLEMAAAEERLNEARTKQLKNQNELVKANDEVMKQEIAARDEKKKQAIEANELPGRTGFESDQLARAGLFAGSALLFNPGMNVEVQQLEVLRRIEANTDKNSMFSP